MLQELDLRGVDWTQLSQDGDKPRFFVNLVTTIQIPKKMGELKKDCVLPSQLMKEYLQNFAIISAAYPEINTDVS